MSLLPLAKGWGPLGISLNWLNVCNSKVRIPAMLLVAGFVCGILLGFNPPAKANGPDDTGDSTGALRSYVQLVSAAQADQAAAKPAQPSEARVKLAEADSLFGAVQEYLDRQDGAAPEKPAGSHYVAPVSRPTGESPRPNATFVGPKVCLGCHQTQANSFGHTVMGRLVAQGDHSNRTKLECETCHGPGSEHMRYAGCAGCHGERGISTRAGIPTLAGISPEYLKTQLKSFASGERKNEIMGPVAARLRGGEIDQIARYYAGQAAERAETPLLGDTKAGQELVASTCVACHGDKGTDPSMGPRLAGQNAQYLYTQLKAFREGKRKNETMNAMVASLDEKTIISVASYYASLEPGRPAGKIAVANAPVPAAIGAARGADGSSVGGIISYRSDDPSRTPEQNNAICLNCHERGDRAYWKGSTHEARNVACTNCHTIMKAVSAKFQLKTAAQVDTCFQCHKDRRAQMYRSAHMPIREGKVVCTDCHNPHGSSGPSLLKTDTVNDTCYKCHAEKRGPFLFEHLPVRENCMNCHDPHGSVNEASLKMSRPRLCLECHGGGHGQYSRPGGQPPAGGGNTMVYAVGRACNNCHQQIHGSNSPAGAFLHR
jgi:DmsE family decaheme c-type cytochrome